MALEGNRAGAEALTAILQKATSSTLESKGAVVRGLTSGLNGHTSFPEPIGWGPLYTTIQSSTDEVIRGQARRLGVIFGNEEALKELRIILVAPDTKENERLSAVVALAARKDAEAFDAIVQIAIQSGSGKLAQSAITALASYPGDKLAPKLIPAYRNIGAPEKAAILQSLCQSRVGSQSLIAAIDGNHIPLKDLGTSNARTIRGFQDGALNTWLDTQWGAVNGNRAGFAEELVRYKKFLGDTAIIRADAKRGKELFRGMCAICHTMFGTGGNIGPQLTGSYTDTDYLLHNILDPNAEIGKDFQQVFIEAKDGSLRAGMIAGEDSSSVTLKTLAGPATIPLNEIRSRKVSPDSMMPTGLLGGLQEADVRNLFLYLRQPKELE